MRESTFHAPAAFLFPDAAPISDAAPAFMLRSPLLRRADLAVVL
ncbi:hypothetical protein HMPREF0972_00700 [Actinomyces sp. oral taxon 848 str. F0332]|nr:hypothetical protein HMPREF0972_00700 [Actinomyces sp. oral taxon 848 str. F0332]